MFRKISADKIYPVTAAPIENGVVVVDSAGKIVSLDRAEQHDAAELEKYSGVIVPGFINAHCHLELSHLKGVAQTGTGLIDFISQVISNRNHAQEIIRDAIAREAQYMLENGIVAVGDISNTADTFLQKQQEQLHYYTFVEYFDMFQTDRTAATMAQYDAVFHQLQETTKNKISRVPHAPYSVSRGLFQQLCDTQQGKTISIHNQETPPENELFQHKTGDFISFYERIGCATKDIPALHTTSIHYALEYLNSKNRTLFVHNTLTQKQDIAAAHDTLGKEQVFWATCPNANLYIENNLPYYRHFLDMEATVCIGTDSLTSNWQLNILDEIKTILKYQSYLDFETVLAWATINGAKALGFDATLGSIEAGKLPGLVLIDNMENGKLTYASGSKRII